MNPLIRAIALPAEAPFEKIQVTIYPSPGNPDITVQIKAIGGSWIMRSLLWALRGFTDRFYFDKAELRLAIKEVKEGKNLYHYELIRNQQTVKRLLISIYVRENYWDILSAINSTFYRGNPSAQYNAADCIEIIEEISRYLK